MKQRGIRCPSYSRLSLRGMASVAAAVFSVFSPSVSAAVKMQRSDSSVHEPSRSDVRIDHARVIDRVGSERNH